MSTIFALQTLNHVATWLCHVTTREDSRSSGVMSKNIYYSKFAWQGGYSSLCQPWPHNTVSNWYTGLAAWAELYRASSPNPISHIVYHTVCYVSPKCFVLYNKWNYQFEQKHSINEMLHSYLMTMNLRVHHICVTNAEPCCNTIVPCGINHERGLLRYRWIMEAFQAWNTNNKNNLRTIA